jgi:predicted metal-dependent phosphoesterase TrpH
MKADLHIHSTVSDGSWTIPEIISRAKARGLDVIAITDHDTFSHLAQLPENPGIRLVPGLEISAADPGSGLRAHILGYNIQAPAAVSALTQPLLEARHKNTLRQIEILRAHGYELDPGKLKAADGKYLYKAHIMDYLVDTGQAEEMYGEFYRRIFRNGGICHFDIEYIDAFKAVRAVREAGGQAVLAHPGQQQNFHLIPGLVRSGLNGLELNHPANREKDRDVLREYADRFRLFLTGGSDFHGKYERPSVGIGDYLSEPSGVSAVCDC